MGVYYAATIVELAFGLSDPIPGNSQTFIKAQTTLFTKPNFRTGCGQQRDTAISLNIIKIGPEQLLMSAARLVLSCG